MKCCWVVAGAALVFGCVDAGGEYADFKDRFEKLYPPSVGGAGGAGGAGGQDAGACTVPSVGEIDGDYLFALSAIINGDPANKNRPIMVLNTVTTKDVGGSLFMDWSLQPLNRDDRKTPVGAPLAIKDIAIDAVGKFDVDPAELDVNGAANPLTGSDITADLSSIKGSICDLDGFYCGSVAGDVSKPFTISLSGSTWAMEKIENGLYPEPPKIDCAKNEALTLPLPPL